MNKQDLEAYREQRRRLRRLYKTIKQLDAELQGPKGSSLDGMPRGSDISRPTERKAIKRAEYVNKYRRIKQDLLDRRPAIEAALVSLPVREQRALRYRYLDALAVSQVGQKMNYSERHVYRILEKGLELLEGQEQ